MEKFIFPALSNSPVHIAYQDLDPMPDKDSGFFQFMWGNTLLLLDATNLGNVYLIPQYDADSERINVIKGTCGQITAEALICYNLSCEESEDNA